MDDRHARSLTLSTLAVLTLYFGFIFAVTFSQAGGSKGMLSAGDNDNSYNDSNSCDTSSSGTTNYSAQADFGKGGGGAFTGFDDISFCYNLDLENKNSTPRHFTAVWGFPIGPYPNANTVTAALEVELFDEDGDGNVSLTASGPGGKLQTSSLNPGGLGHGVDVGTTINTAGKHMFDAGPIAGPTSVSPTGFMTAIIEFTLSAKDRVRLKGMMLQEDGITPHACMIPLTSMGSQLTKDMQKCANDSSKSLAKSINTGNKELCTCIKALVKSPGTAPSIADCLLADAKGKIAKAAASAQKKFDKKCVGQDKNGIDKLPPFGAADPNDPEVDDAVQSTPRILAEYAFGMPPTNAILSFAGDKNATKCQQALIKELKKCFETRLKEYTSCKKKALKAGAADADTLAACINADPKEKIAKACDRIDKPDKLRKVLEKKCVKKGVPLDTVFPGAGVAGNVDATHAGLHDDVPCLACMVIGHLDDLGDIDCDLLDDGLTNGSCSVW